MPRRRNRSESSDQSSEEEAPRARGGAAIHEVADHNRARKIKVFRNGDLFDTGREFTISAEKYPKFEIFLDYLARTLDVRWPIHHLYSVEGEEANTMDDLEAGQSYVACQKELVEMEYGAGGAPGWKNTYKLEPPPPLPDEPPTSARNEPEPEKRRSKSHDKKKKDKKKDKKRSSRYAD